MTEFGMAVVAMFAGAFWGTIGQSVRVIIGLKKSAAENRRFNGPLLLQSIVIGAAAGALAGLAFPWGEQLERGEILALMAAGYAGTDFIEGLMKSRLPGTSTSAAISKQ